MNNKNGHLRQFGRFQLDAEKKVLTFEEKPVEVQLKEIELLCFLTENGGEILTKEEILNRVWADSFVEESNLSQHIYRLRKIFREFGETAEFIQTVPRRGYRWTGETKENKELIIERHFVSKTLIEELEDSVEPNLKAVSAKPVRTKAGRYWLPIAACLAFLTIAFGFYFYNSIQTSANQPIKSVAVLPLKSLDNTENKALSYGFADALITNLGKIDKLKVLSTNSVNHFAEQNKEPLEIGKLLKVDAVIDGTLQRANGKYRVTLRLLRTADGKQIWSNSFDKPESEIFGLQDLMALQTSQALEFNLTTKTKHETANVEAYQFYLQGLYIFRRRGTSNVNSAPLFKKAIELDPKFAKAYAGLAGVYAIGVSMEEAETTINKALELDPDLAEAHAVRGFIKMFLDWDWNEAEKSLNRAVELDGNSVEALHWRGTLHQIRGKFDEAKADLKRAMELDPTSANMTSDLGYIYFFAREFDEAEKLLKTAEMMESNIANNRLMLLYELQGRENEALQVKIQFYCSRLDNENKSKCEERFTQNFENGGIKGIAKDNIEFNEESAKTKDLDSDIWYGLAISYLQIGNKEKALDSLKRSIETKKRFETMNFSFPFIKSNPIFAEVKSESEFQEILRKVNF